MSNWTNTTEIEAANDRSSVEKSISTGKTLELENRGRSDLTILGCVECAGVWLDQGTLLALQRDARADAQAQMAAGAVRYGLAEGLAQRPTRYRKCPECNRQMSRRNFAYSSGIILDSCPQHGTFFDSGELPAVIRFVQSGGLEEELNTVRAGGSQSLDRHSDSIRDSFQIDQLKDYSISELAYDIVFPLAVWILHKYRLLVRGIFRS